MSSGLQLKMELENLKKQISDISNNNIDNSFFDRIEILEQKLSDFDLKFTSQLQSLLYQIQSNKTSDNFVAHSDFINKLSSINNDISECKTTTSFQLKELRNTINKTDNTLNEFMKNTQKGNAIMHSRITANEKSISDNSKIITSHSKSIKSLSNIEN